MSEHPRNPTTDRITALILTLGLDEDSSNASSPPPQISRSLYRKAAEHNADLTQSERILLLSRLDLVGKALARPNSLTEAQRDAILGRPPPDVLRDDITRVVMPGRGVSSVAEVMRALLPLSSEGEKEKEAEEGHDRSPEDAQKVEEDAGKAEADGEEQAIDPATTLEDAIKAQLRYAALECITRNWWTFASEDAHSVAEPLPEEGPGGAAAAELLAGMRPDEKAFEDAVRDVFCSPWADEAAAADADGVTEESDENGEALMTIEQRAEAYAAEVARLREELRAQVREEVAAMTEGGFEEWAALLERMDREVAEDEEEDAKEGETEATERKRELEELAEEKQRKRMRREEAGYGEDDGEDDAEDHVVGSIFD